MHAFKSIREAKMWQYCSCWWPKRNISVCFLFVLCTYRAAHSFLPVCKLGKCCVLVLFLLTSSPCPFYLSIHPLWSFLFLPCNPAKKSPALFPISQRFPEIARYIHTVPVCTPVSLPLLSMLSLLHQWPPCWPWGFSRKNSGLPATSGNYGADIELLLDAL